MSNLTEQPQRPENGAALARVAESVAAIRASVEVAQARPRDEEGARLRALASMQRVGIADAAQYSFPRGKTDVTGPTVKLARELARCWGNIQHGVKIISRDDTEVHIEGWAWDLESNSRVSKESRFAPLVQRKVGKYPNQETKWIVPDERDLNELIAKRGAVLTRNAILELVPSDLVDDCLSRAADTLAKAEAGGDREEQIARTCAAFKPYGVTREMIEGKFGEWTPGVVVTLRSAFNAIRDGLAKPSEFFGETKKSTADILADVLRSKKPEASPDMDEAEVAEPEAPDVAIMRGDYDGTDMFAREGEGE